LSATELARLITSGTLSSREAVEAHISRIEVVNSRLNAVVVPLFEQALAESDAADYGFFFNCCLSSAAMFVVMRLCFRLAPVIATI
jgi:hypothetical protein